MGRKPLIPYGLYRAHGFYSAHLAKQTGVTQDDLAIVWLALQGMWDLDRSAARGLMACRGLHVYSHESALGNAPAHALFERITVERKEQEGVPRRFSDYQVGIVDTELPDGVSLVSLVG